MEKLKRLEDLTSQIDEIDSQLKSLQEKKVKLCREKLDILNENAPLEERFSNWVEYAQDKCNYSSIKKAIAPSTNRNLFEYEDYLWWERREVLYIENIAQELLDSLAAERSGNRTYEKRATEQEVLEWMQILMDLNLGSVRMDW